MVHLKSQSLELTLLDAWLDRLRLLRLPLPLSEYSEVKDSCEKSQLDRSLSMMMNRRAPIPPNMPRLDTASTAHARRDVHAVKTIRKCVIPSIY